MLFIELSLRIAGITLLLLLGTLCLRDARNVKAARYGALLCVGLIAVLAGSVSEASTAPPIALRYFLLPISSTTTVLIWWFCLALLEDDFRLGRIEWGVAAIWTALGLFNIHNSIRFLDLDHEWAVIARTFMAAGIVAHIVYVALSGRKSDLIEERRRARIFIAFAISFLLMTDIFSERFFGYFYTPLAFNLAQVIAFVGVLVWSVFWLLRLDGSLLAFETRKPMVAVAPVLSSRDKALQHKLTTIMEVEKAYLETDLSIGSLAGRVGVPEHQLRAFINQTMGHRNFRAFLNGYRMEAAKEALLDPDKASLPILTIAMDSGFASLASFNRAFKTATGKTPSQYRNGENIPASTGQN